MFKTPLYLISKCLIITGVILIPALAKSEQLGEFFYPENQQEIGSSIRVVESAVESGVSRHNVVSSNNNLYQAFTVCLPKPGVDGCLEALFIEETKTGRFYEIQGVPIEWRPFSNLFWTREDLLIFERWSNPNFGYRYTVDIKAKKLIKAIQIDN